MLTLSQQKTYDYIKQYIAERGCSPTTAEIASGIGISSRGVVYRYLKSLVEANKISLTPNRHRNIELISDESVSDYEIPLKGTIAAGEPIDAIEQQDTISLKQYFNGDSNYALVVRGDSMIEEGIVENDIVICRRSSTADNGDIVVALIDNQEATLKRWHRVEGGNIKLIPANKNLTAKTYPEERITVQGIFIGLLRLP